MTHEVAQRALAKPAPRGARADVIGKKIADDIVLGRIQPGARLDEVTLAGLFKMRSHLLSARTAAARLTAFA